MLNIEDIREIRKAVGRKGYEVDFGSGKVIWLTKRRTIIALLMLIKYGTSSEADLARGSERLMKVKEIVRGKIQDDSWIQEGYADANKPFSELWNEEGFTWIHPAQEKLQGNQSYVLYAKHHDHLFSEVKKARRTAPEPEEGALILERQSGLCNFCGSQLHTRENIMKTTFAKDRVRVVYDHRIPVEKGGDSEAENYQALCFYCNKSKWQICNICHLQECSSTCALAFPETSQIISPTSEDIGDRLKSRRLA